MQKENLKMKEKIDFTTGSIKKSMLLFAIPFMLGILIQNLYGAVDLFVVGKFATNADASAVTNGSQLMNIVTQIIIGLASGLTVLIGKYYGSKDDRKLKKVTGTAIITFVIIGIVLTIIYLLFNKLMVLLVQTPGEAIDKANDYLFACSFGIVFIVGFNVINSILSGLGNSKTPFIFIAIACVINIVLDLIFVIKFDMGAYGVAIATTIAQACSFLSAIIYLFIKGIGYSFSKSDVKIDQKELSKTLKIGIPVAIQNVLVSLSFLFITAIINRISLEASTAVGAVEKLITFLFVPATAFGTTVATAVSQNIGANQNRRATNCVNTGIIMCLIPSIIILILVVFKGEMFISIFSNDKVVIDLGANYIKSYIFDIIFVCFVFCFNAFFNSLNKSWISMSHSIFTTVLIRIPLAYIFSIIPNTSLIIIGLAAPISTLISLLICLFFYRKLIKKEFNLETLSN